MIYYVRAFNLFHFLFQEEKFKEVEERKIEGVKAMNRYTSVDSVDNIYIKNSTNDDQVKI